MIYRTIFVLCIIFSYITKATMLVCENENVSLWALSIYISRYPTTFEGAYNISIYNIGIYNIVAL